MALLTKSATLGIGDKIPEFTSQDQDGRPFSIRDYIGKKKLVIYFYPKDESGLCTKEACAFRDSYTDFTRAGAMVIGINAGSVESHKAFKAHHNLPFTLLSDPGNKVLKQFGIKNVLFLTGRETFLVDLDGKIGASFRAFLNGAEHSAHMLSFLDNNA